MIPSTSSHVSFRRRATAAKLASFSQSITTASKSAVNREPGSDHGTAPATTDLATTRAPSRWRPTRRGFLIGAGVAGGGLAFGWVVGRPWLRLQIADLFENGSQPSTASKEPSAWFEIASSGLVTLFMTKVEMGQGIHTALAQVAAEELALPWSSLTVVQASTRRRPDDRSGTSGSSSMSSQ